MADSRQTNSAVEFNPEEFLSYRDSTQTGSPRTPAVGAVPTTQSAQVTTTTQSGFDPDAFLAYRGDTAEPEAATGLQDKTPGGYVTSEPVVISDIEAIAAKYGQDKEWLLETAQWMGVPVYSRSGAALPQMGRVTAGEVGERIFLGIPQWIGKKMVDDPASRDAMDELRELRRSRQSYLSGFTEAASGMAVPGLGAAGKAASATQRVATGVGLGAAGALAQSREGEEITSAVIGGTLGGTLGLAPEIIKGVGKAGRKVLGPLLNSAPEEGDSLVRGATQYLQDNKVLRDGAKAAEGIVGTEWTADAAKLESILRATKGADGTELLIQATKLMSGRNDLTDYGTIAKVLANHIKTDGVEHVRKSIADVTQARAMTEYAASRGIRHRPTEWEPMNVASDFISDTRYVFKDIDRRHDLDMLPTLDKLSSDYNVYMTDITEFGSKLRERIRELGDYGVSQERLYQLLDGTAKPASRAETEVLGAWRGMSDQMLDDAAAAGVTIARRDNYVPHYMASSSEVLRRLDKRMRAEVGSSLGHVTDKQFGALSDETKQAVAYLSDAPGWRGMDASDYNGLMDDILAGGSRGQLGPRASVAKSSLTRDSDVPDLLREKDLGKLYLGWAHSTYRHARLREGLQAVRAKLPVLSSIGDDRAHKYTSRWLADMSGSSRGLSRMGDNMRNKWEYAMLRRADIHEEAGNSLASSAFTTAAKAPGLLHSSLQLIYPNALGLNIRAVARNLTQPYLLTAPELQGGYGIRTAFSALKQTVSKLATDPAEVQRALRRNNLVPPKYQGENLHILTEEVIRSSPYGMTRQAASKVADTMMWFYEKSDIVNRYTTLRMAESVSADLLAGNPGAQRYLNSLSASYRRVIKEAVRAGDQGRVSELMARQLLAETQFNYNKLNMAEYGRTLGPLFSVFSKWPTAIAGDIIEKVRAGMTGRAAAKYLGPLAGLYALDALVAPGTLPGVIGEKARGQAQIDLTDSDRAKQFLIGRGLRTWAPVDAAKSIWSRELFDTPGVSVVSDLIDSAIEADSDAGWKVLNTATRSYVPGAGIVRFLTDDIPTLVSGKKPEGAFLEKIGPGAKSAMDELEATINSIYDYSVPD